MNCKSSDSRNDVRWKEDKDEKKYKKCLSKCDHYGNLKFDRQGLGIPNKILGKGTKLGALNLHI